VRGLETRTSRCRQKDSSKPLLEDVDGATTPERSRLACMPQYDRLRWICLSCSKAATMNDDLGSTQSQGKLEVRTRRRIDTSHTRIGLHSRRLSSLWLSARIDGQLRASFWSASMSVHWNFVPRCWQDFGHFLFAKRQKRRRLSNTI
jgi:hypothetical protein